MYKCSRFVETKKCNTCGDAAAASCQEPLRGHRSGEVCGRAACKAHVVVGADGVKRCPPHGRIAAKVETRRAAVGS